VIARAVGLALVVAATVPARAGLAAADGDHRTQTAAVAAGTIAPPPPPSPPDEDAIAQVEESNLEWPRDGFRISLSVGPSMQVGFDISESSGSGVGFSLRLGTASGPRSAWILEAAATGYLAEDDAGQTRTNNSTLLAVGSQLHLAEAAWIRFGGGYTTFSRDTEETSVTDFRGVGAVAAAGYDVVRRGRFALSTELVILAAYYGSGYVGSGFFGLGVTGY